MPEPFETNQPAINKQEALNNSPWLKHAALEVQNAQIQQRQHDDNASATDLLVDAGYSLVYQGGQSWVRSLGQIGDDFFNSGTKIADAVTILPKPEETTYRSNRWYAQQVGGGIGYFAPFAITHTGLKTAGLTFAARTSETVASTGKLFSAANGLKLADSAVLGFVSDFTFRPVEEGGSHLVARAKHGLTGAAVMTTMTAGSLGLRQMTGSIAADLVGDSFAEKAGRVVYDAGIGIGSGAPAGAAGAEVTARLWENRGATEQELRQGAFTMAWTGAVLSAREILPRDAKVLENAREQRNQEWRDARRKGENPPRSLVRQSVNAVDSAYYGTRATVRDTYTEARRSTYKFLNEHDMRHPIQRLRNALLEPEIAEAPRAKLTAENNPIAAFEKELPKFFQTIEAKEREMQELPSTKDQYEVFKQMQQVRLEFATKLVRLWHGTAEQPGIKAFSDAELATPESTAGRVAEIRDALTKEAKSNGGYGSTSELTTALLKLYGKEVDASNSHINILGEIEPARRDFYGIDYDGMTAKMQMPRTHASWDHEPGTPLTWMPAIAKPGTPDLYHGTMSPSLPSVLTERALLPARELRLRGIEQKTGESATEEHGRQSISITRDYNEAFAYHRMGPTNLVDFPVVFGISRTAARRAYLPMGPEPGELVIDRLGIGKSSITTRLGLRRPDITHIFVPDSEVPSVQNQIKAARISGVQVQGFNQMKAPEWGPNPWPKPDALEPAYGF